MKRIMFVAIAVMASVALFAGAKKADCGKDFKVEKSKVDLKKASEVYKKNCASCHGDDGKGNTPTAQALKPRPRDFTNKEYMSKRSDCDIYTVIKKGGSSIGLSPLMTPFEKILKEDEIKALVVYIRNFSNKK